MSKAYLVAGLAWGDEGKGAAVDYLCREHGAKLVVRYNGGCQCAHNVVTADGKHHTFAQFGSGTLIPGVKTFLSKYMLVNPISMMHEAEVLEKLGVKDVFNRITVSSNALVVTPFDKALNRIRETVNEHGSCGVGIGETRRYSKDFGDDALVAGDLLDRQVCMLKLKLREMRARETATKFASSLVLANSELQVDHFLDDLVDKYSRWANLSFVHNWPLNTLIEWNGKPEPVVFEGAQGILLDERDEFLPHNTWTDTTFANAETLLDRVGFKGEIVRIGCLRSYMTRHGAGPFPTEAKEDGFLYSVPELHNTDKGFQGKFRKGHFDMASVKHALDICGGVDEIHMSHMDQLPDIYPGTNAAAYVSNIERLLETPITVLGYGPTAEDRRKRDAKGIVARRRHAQAQPGVSLSTARQA